MIRPLVLLLATSAFLFARDFENGDFSNQKTGWFGDGNLVYLKADGTVTKTKESGATPAVQIDLSSNQFRELSQKFSTGADTASLEVEVVYRGSSDFAVNAKSNKFSKDINWSIGGTWYWSALVFPKADLTLRLDKPDGYCYYMAKVTPGGDWQTARVRWDVAAKKDVRLLILTAPGDGYVLIKSVSVISK